MPKLQNLPLVTVVMPVYNEERFIDRSLDAVLRQDYPRLEVLVVDGRSTDRTPQIVKAAAERDSRVRLLDNPGRIQSRALNLALNAAQGDVIARVDGHTIIAPDYISRCVYHLLETGADNVGGPQSFAGTTPMGRAIAAAYRSAFSVPSRFTISQQALYVDTVYMGAWPRSLFERVGLFDEELAANEDYELNYRIRKAGGRIYLSPDIRSDYYGRQTLGALWHQFFQYGRGKFRVLVKHPASARPRHVVAPAFVAVLVIGGLLAPLSRWMARLWLLVLVSYSLVNVIVSIRQAARNGWGLLPRLPLVFACIHLAWGSGFWRQALARLVGTERSL